MIESDGIQPEDEDRDRTYDLLFKSEMLRVGAMKVDGEMSDIYQIEIDLRINTKDEERIVEDLRSSADLIESFISEGFTVMVDQEGVVNLLILKRKEEIDSLVEELTRSMEEVQ